MVFNVQQEIGFKFGCLIDSKFVVTANSNRSLTIGSIGTSQSVESVQPTAKNLLAQ